MWSFFVVPLEPLFRLFTDLVQALNHEHIEQRFPVAAIESFDEAILHRLAWFDGCVFNEGALSVSDQETAT